LLKHFPDAVRRDNAAPLIRDRQELGVCNDPGSAAHHFVLRCARDMPRDTPTWQTPAVSSAQRCKTVT
jgi:hypothetical protein